MSGADKLNGKIMEDAEKKASENMEDARRKAEDTIQKARDEAEKIKEEMIQNAQAEAERLKERIISIAELESRKDKLKAKQDMVAEVLNKAVERLVSLPAEKYKKILVDMIVPLIKEGTEKIVLAVADRERLTGINHAVNAELSSRGRNASVSISEEIRYFKGGFVLKRGRIEINSTFETVMRMKRSEFEKEITEILFEQQDTGGTVFD